MALPVSATTRYALIPLSLALIVLAVLIHTADDWNTVSVVPLDDEAQRTSVPWAVARERRLGWRVEPMDEFLYVGSHAWHQCRLADLAETTAGADGTSGLHRIRPCSELGPVGSLVPWRVVTDANDTHRDADASTGGTGGTADSSTGSTGNTGNAGMDSAASISTGTGTDSTDDGTGGKMGSGAGNEGGRVAGAGASAPSLLSTDTGAAATATTATTATATVPVPVPVVVPGTKDKAPWRPPRWGTVECDAGPVCTQTARQCVTRHRKRIVPPSCADPCRGGANDASLECACRRTMQYAALNWSTAEAYAGDWGDHYTRAILVGTLGNRAIPDVPKCAWPYNDYEDGEDQDRVGADARSCTMTDASVTRCADVCNATSAERQVCTVVLTAPYRSTATGVFVLERATWLPDLDGAQAASLQVPRDVLLGESAVPSSSYTGGPVEVPESQLPTRIEVPWTHLTTCSVGDRLCTSRQPDIRHVVYNRYSGEHMRPSRTVPRLQKRVLTRRGIEVAHIFAWLLVVVAVAVVLVALLAETRETATAATAAAVATTTVATAGAAAAAAGAAATAEATSVSVASAVAAAPVEDGSEPGAHSVSIELGALTDGGQPPPPPPFLASASASPLAEASAPLLGQGQGQGGGGVLLYPVVQASGL